MVKRRKREIKSQAPVRFEYSGPKDYIMYLKYGSIIVAAVLSAYLVFMFFPADAEEDLVNTITEQIEEPEPEKEIIVTVLNGCGVSGIAGKMADFLRENGIKVLETKNADNRNYAQTIVINKDKTENFARDIAALIGTQNITYLDTQGDSSHVDIILGKDYPKIKPFIQN